MKLFQNIYHMLFVPCEPEPLVSFRR